MKDSAMGFDFNPTIWFVCRLCRRSFASTEALKEHKVACHLTECLGIKCIIFEERLLAEEWKPANNLCDSQDQIFYTELDSELSKDKLLLLPVDRSDDNNGFKKDDDFTSLQTSSSKDEIYFEDEVLIKKEFPIFKASTPSYSEVREDAYYNELEDVKQHQEFIEVSVSPDEVHGIKLGSTLYPTSPQGYQLLEQQSVTISNPETCSGITESQHQELISESEYERNEFHSNSTTVEMESNIYNSDLLTTFEMHTEESFEQVGELNQAQQSAVEKPFMCETCFAFFRTRELLKSHMLRHSSAKPFQCSQCPARFKGKKYLNRHQIVHGMETNFKCRFCNKCLTDKTNLVVHERSHTGDRPFKCEVANCDYAGSSKTRLIAHTRGKHSEELGLQQFVCPRCGKTYGIRSSLDEHIRTHHSDTVPPDFLVFTMYDQ